MMSSNGGGNGGDGGGGQIFKDRCTGETKKLLPYLPAESKQEFDILAVKVVPKSKLHQALTTRQPCQQLKTCKLPPRTKCYQCGPRREDPYPQDPRCYKLEYSDGFDEFKVGQKQGCVWNYFTNLSEECGDGEIGFTANDGKHKLSAKEGLILTAPRFTKTFVPKREQMKRLSAYNHDYEDPYDDEDETNSYLLDRFKLLIVLNADFTIPECGELYAAACISGKTHGTENHPFGDAVINHMSDLRLAYCCFSMIDFELGLHIAFALTNDSIYALYERLPVDIEDGKEDGKGPASFAFAHLIGRRNHKNPLADFADFGLAIDKRKGAKWYVDGVLKYSISRLGHLSDPSDALYQFSGEPTSIMPQCAHIGFGLCTMLDAVQPNNAGDKVAAGTGLVKLTEFEYQHPWYADRTVEFKNSDNTDRHAKLFGQGASMKIKNVRVELRA